MKEADVSNVGGKIFYARIFGDAGDDPAYQGPWAKEIISGNEDGKGKQEEEQNVS